MNARLVVRPSLPLDTAQSKTGRCAANGIVHGGSRCRGIEAIMEQEPGGVGGDVGALEGREGQHPAQLGAEGVGVGEGECDDACERGIVIGTMANLVEYDEEGRGGVALEPVLDEFGEMGGGWDWVYEEIREELRMWGEGSEKRVIVENRLGNCMGISEGKRPWSKGKAVR